MYSRYLHEKIGLVYPLNPNLKSLLDDVISDSRWDMTYLGMQVLIEGLALAAFALLRNMAQDPLARAINAYVMQDEARHVMFGRLALRDYYPQLTQAERDDREEFCVDACYRMRDRFLGEEVWRTLELPDEVTEWVNTSELQRTFRGFLFMRIVPILKDIGLWGPQIQRAFTDMGVSAWADTDIDAAMAEDEQVAEELDREQDPPGPRRGRRRPGLTGSSTGQQPRPAPAPTGPPPTMSWIGPDPGHIDDVPGRPCLSGDPGRVQADQVWRSTVIAASASVDLDAQARTRRHQEMCVVQLERGGQIARSSDVARQVARQREARERGEGQVGRPPNPVSSIPPHQSGTPRARARSCRRPASR